ncbi:unnamed protein product, partial [marine sediment metagenome]
MNIDELDNGICVIVYDVPAPDQWKTHLRIIYSFEPFDKDLELLNEEIEMRKCPKCKEPINLDVDLESEPCPNCEEMLSEKEIKSITTISYDIIEFFGK